MRLLFIDDLGRKAVFNFLLLLPPNQRRDALKKGDGGG